jgi:hypothetical protein
VALRRFLFQSTEGYADSAALTDETQLAKITLSGIAGVAVDAGNQKIVQLATPTADTDAANKSYVDSVAAGLDWKASVKYATAAPLPSYTAAGSGVGKTLTGTANGALIVDGVAVSVSDRILVKDEGGGTSVHNGIYVVTATGDASNPYVLTRATDFDGTPGGEVSSGNAVFVEGGATNADQGYVLITDDPITVDVTALTFTQFTGLGQVTAGSGLVKTGNTISVKKGDGIELVSNGAAVNVDLDTNSGLALNGTSPNKKLAWNPDTTRGLNKDAAGAYIALAANPGLQFSGGLLEVKVNSTTGALNKDANGIYVMTDETPDTLDITPAGLKVVGLPSLFKINGVSVGATVTAPNLDILTNGSNADALHVHSSGSSNEVAQTWTASGNITKGDGVYISGNNTVSTGDSTNDTKSRIIGVADQNISNTASGTIKILGVVTGVLTGATAGTRYFLGSTGQPVLISALPGGSRTVQLGIAKNSTDLFVQVFDYGKKPV